MAAAIPDELGRRASIRLLSFLCILSFLTNIVELLGETSFVHNFMRDGTSSPHLCLFNVVSCRDYRFSTAPSQGLLRRAYRVCRLCGSWWLIGIIESFVLFQLFATYRLTYCQHCMRRSKYHPTATIATTPGALLPVEVTSAALPPSPQTAANLDTGSNSIAIDKTAQIQAVDGTAGGETNRTQSALGGNPLVPAAPGPGTLPVPIIVELASAGASQPGTQRSVPSFATTDHGFAERMLEALDKYEAQATERFRDNSRSDRRLDLNL